MRTSQYLLMTLKETPADAEIVSHRLMLRAGMIRKLASGIYNWLPLGLRVLRKVEAIVRDEMNRSGALELLMPATQPAELWEETGRWAEYGDDLLKITDRHERQFCFAPTAEEVVTDIMRHVLRSYKQLPVNVYQIQTKFRDEIRPRFGVMRAREFLMKDAYSFHLDQASLDETYQKMYQAYCNIIERLGLKYRAVWADSGAIGGKFSQEFQILADTGEDKLAFSDASDYAANIERAEALAPTNERPTPTADMETVDTPGLYTIDTLVKAHNLDIKKTVKTLLVAGDEDDMVALIVRGDHELNTLKAEKIDGVAKPLRMMSDDEIVKKIGVKPGSIGPVNLDMPVIVDRDAALISDFSCGANIQDKHFMNVNWERDVVLPTVADLRNVVEGDTSPDGKGKLYFTRGIEVGHIFQHDTKYSEIMDASVLTENGKASLLKTGCYGMGISRIVAAAIEQNHDDNGMIWPDAMAPFQVVIVPMNMHKAYRVREAAEQLYQELLDAGIEVLFDDRKERAGVMFAEMDLIGIPHRLVIGERGLDRGVVEYKHRRESESQEWALDAAVNQLKELIKL